MMMEGMEQPLISCIMPTKNRRAFVGQALRYFERQDYPNKELIVVDDGDDLVVDLVSQYPRVRYLAPQYMHSVGGKRNIACEAASGEIICHWDDDDWYAPTRLSYQVVPLLTGEADMTGLHLQSVLDLEPMQGWRCPDATLPRPGVQGLHHGTLLYWRHLWANRARFQDTSDGEDTRFVRRLINLGTRVYTLPCLGQHVYIRHYDNGWRYQPGTTIDTEVWEQMDAGKYIPPEDMGFYADLSEQYIQRKREKMPIKNMRRHFGDLLTSLFHP
jgi:glycosyltransferase involved in cell wall biosynthesis